MSKNKKRGGLLLVLALIALVIFVVLPKLQGEETAVSAPQLQELQQLEDALTELPPETEDGEPTTDLVLTGDSSAPADPDGSTAENQADAPAAPETEPLAEDGSYSSKEDVTAYLLTYGRLPANFITKKQAQQAGWPGGSLEPYCPGKCIGGDRFGNREGLLPSAPGRIWIECDIDTLGASSRGAKRLVFSNDGLIYYTDDHYESFQLVYGEP